MKEQQFNELKGMHMNGLSRWQRPALMGFQRLNDELSALFGTALGNPAELWDGFAPALDVYEDKDSYVVKAELPGMKREDIQVSFHEGNLSISGERKSEQKHKDAEVYRNERYFGRFERTVSVPSRVAADKISAQYKDGVLTITLPKSEEAKPKQIDVTIN